MKKEKSSLMFFGFLFLLLPIKEKEKNKFYRLAPAFKELSEDWVRRTHNDPVVIELINTTNRVLTAMHQKDMHAAEERSKLLCLLENNPEFLIALKQETEIKALIEDLLSIPMIEQWTVLFCSVEGDYSKILMKCGGGEEYEWRKYKKDTWEVLFTQQCFDGRMKFTFFVDSSIVGEWDSIGFFRR